MEKSLKGDSITAEEMWTSIKGDWRVGTGIKNMCHKMLRNSLD